MARRWRLLGRRLPRMVAMDGRAPLPASVGSTTATLGQRDLSNLSFATTRVVSLRVSLREPELPTLGVHDGGVPELIGGQLALFRGHSVFT
jgi:hypothetical protein